MNPWPFVTGAYVVTLGGAGALAVVSYLAMRRAERAGGQNARSDRR